MKRTPVNPSEWGLQWSLNQGEVFEGITRHLHCSGQVALEPDATSEMGIRVVGEGDMRAQISSALGNIDEVLAHHNGNKVHAAAALGIDRKTLYRRAERRERRARRNEAADQAAARPEKRTPPPMAGDKR